ncbi:hypothetical protein [Microbulbifer pacificus]|uniref:hypothetical protein n=1 Tax=Microbulbifer pacificus TaxID=407164 RepID=UPI000CF4DF82|nr:hypothetical protein [Microbulbifer pacificus]
MSGRKKNRRHQHGQPPHELLRELNSLRELLGNDMDADIPLLDQVAESSSDQKANNAQPHRSSQRAPNHSSNYAPRPPQRPLTEVDLPILFSPVDEEPVDDFDEYVPELSEADRELLRPLQDLPRPPAVEPTPAIGASQPSTPVDAHRSESPRGEYQPELFEPESETLPAPAVPRKTAATNPAPPPTVQLQANLTTGKTPMTDNPFLPPHIRARLTGGKIPRPEPTPPQVPIASPVTQARPEAAQANSHRLSEAEREQLLEQLVAEQLPELERQLRRGITLVLDELYPGKT